MSPKVREGKVVGYIRVSTVEQADSGAGLEAQRAKIEAECQYRGWTLVEIVADPAESSSVPFAERRGGKRILSMLEARQVGGLVVAKLDRLVRSAGESEQLADLFARRRWTLTLLDVQVDTSTPYGEAMAGQMAVWARLERRLIGQRTKEAMATIPRGPHVNRRGELKQAVGRPPETALDVEARVVSLRRSGATLRAIADQLATEGVPCAQGGSWHVSTVRRILGRHVAELPTFRRGPRPAVQPT